MKISSTMVMPSAVGTGTLPLEVISGRKMFLHLCSPAADLLMVLACCMCKNCGICSRLARSRPSSMESHVYLVVTVMWVLFCISFAFNLVVSSLAGGVDVPPPDNSSPNCHLRLEFWWLFSVISWDIRQSYVR